VVDDVTGSRYRLALRGPTHLVPAELDYVEVGNGSAGHVTGIDFMFDPRPVDVAIPSWRVVITLREVGRPATEIHLDPVSALPARVRTVEEHSPRGDATVEVRFGAYGPAGPLTLPVAADDHGRWSAGPRRGPVRDRADAALGAGR
jgi:hypothetical protein